MSEFLSLAEIQYELLDATSKITDFLDQHHLTYFLCGGNLLGAVRHGGFIPWDDDMDLAMPRPDYEKFLELTKKTKIADNLEPHAAELKNLFFPFCKIMILNIKMERVNKSANFDENLWVDIFPWDGLPSKLSARRQVFRKMIFWRKLLMLRVLEKKWVSAGAKSKPEAMLKPPLKILLNLFPTEFYLRQMRKLREKYPYKTAKFVGPLTWGDDDETMEKAALRHKIKIKFEEHDFWTFGNWNYYLCRHYNETAPYVLPPKALQVNHELKVKKVALPKKS